MKPRPLLTAAAVCAAACSSGVMDAAPDGTWVGTITTEGNVTTVVNESGSVWGGTATLVEEASIGVEAGADEYMFGRVSSVAASGDRIYIADSQVPALRVYDWEGGHVTEFGREGRGPGEFSSRISIAVDDDGRVWVDDVNGGRIVVFSSTGEAIATLSTRPARRAEPLVVATDGHAYAHSVLREPDSLRRVVIPYGLDGFVGDPVEVPRFDRPGVLVAERDGSLIDLAVPFSRRGVSVFAPTAAMLSGDQHDYRFRIDRLDGTAMVIERSGSTIAVDPDEAAAQRRAATAYLRLLDPAWTWPDAEIPDTKPAYIDLVPTVSGEVWVVRPGAANPLPGCDDDEFEPRGTSACWREPRIVDAFGQDGRYLGEVVVPEEFDFNPRPFIRGDDVIAVVEDEAGTIMVKRYRLVLPGEEGQ